MKRPQQQRPAALLAAALLVVLAFAAFVVRSQTISELGYTPERCATIRADPSAIGFVPCPCRLNTGLVQAVPCYPNCCPKTDTFEGDRCDMENRLSWTVYEQQICAERPQPEYIDDTANCFYRGNIPKVTSATAAGGVTNLGFQLSLRSDHRCNNLYVASCLPGRVGLDGFFVNTSDPVPQRCWQTCPPTPIQPCTASSCMYHHGETPAVVTSWTLPVQLLPNNYTLVCETFMHGDAEGTTLYQYAYAIIGFRVR